MAMIALTNLVYTLLLLHILGELLSEDEPRRRLFTTLSPTPSEDQKMLLACRAGDLAEVKRLFEQDPKLVHQQDSEGMSALMTAIVEANYEVAEYLVNVSDQDSFMLRDSIGNRAFHYAVYCRSLPLVRKMVEERGCDVVDAVTPKTTNRAVHLAMMTGSVPIVKYLLENGASLLDMVECGPGIIWSAVVQDRIDCFVLAFELLLKKYGTDNSSNDTTEVKESKGMSSSIDKDQPVVEEAKKAQIEMVNEEMEKVDIEASKEEEKVKEDAKKVEKEKEKDMSKDEEAKKASEDESVEKKYPVPKNPALQRGIDGTDLFWHAVSWGATRIVLWLINNKFASWEQEMVDHSPLADLPPGQLPKPTNGGIVVAAALNGAIELLKQAKLNGLKMDAMKDATKESAVYFAAHAGLLDTIKYLEANGAPLMSVTEGGFTPFTAASRTGHVHVLKYLYEKLGSKPELIGLYPGAVNTCLGAAAAMNELKSMKWLIEEGHVDIEEIDSLTYTALHVACEVGSLDALNLLVEHGADSRARVANIKYFPTAFLLATVNSQLKIMERLVELDPRCMYDITQYQRNALISAALGERLDSMEWLIKKETKKFENWSDVDEGKSCMLPFKLTAEGLKMKAELDAKKEAEAAKKEKKAEKKSDDKGEEKEKENEKIDPPLPQTINPHIASHLSEIISDKKYGVVKLLVKSGLHPSLPFIEGNSVLLLAVWYGSVDLVEWLVNEGNADILSLSATGIHASHFAASRGDINMMRCIVNLVSRVSPNFDWNIGDVSDWTPLSFAVSSGHVSMLNFLVDELKVTVQSQLEPNVMELAASSGNVKVFPWLLERGVQFPPHNVHQQPAPFLIALRYGDLEISRYLHAAMKIDLQEQPKVCFSWLKEAMTKDDAIPLVEWLIYEGLSPYHLDNTESSMLHIAAIEGQLDYLRWAHRYGLSLVEPRPDGVAALTLAAHNGRTEIVKYLLSHGVNPARTDNIYRSPGSMAAQNGHDSLGSFFERIGFP